MKKAIAWSVTLFLNLIIIFAVVLGVFAQSPSGDTRVFPTEFVVRGEFLDFFNYHGGIEIFGYPLTIEFEEAGRRVQYFHRGRMELNPENPPEQRVVMGLLGELLKTAEPPIVEPDARPDRRFFSETGHTVAAAFLRYFDTWGGVDFFGYPITEMMVEEGYIVQYFQRARLEWHPDNPPNLRVQLGKLGEIYLDENNFSPGMGVRDPSSDRDYRPVDPPDALDVVASVSHPFAEQNQPQTLFVFVYAQYDAPASTPPIPVLGATVRAVIHFPDKDHEITLTGTNELGLSWQVFDVGQVPVGKEVNIDIVVFYEGAEGTTKTSFLVWL
jgi:hypothetical protein